VRNVPVVLLPHAGNRAKVNEHSAASFRLSSVGMMTLLNLPFKWQSRGDKHLIAVRSLIIDR
jgi:hypothetical protein